MSVIKAKMNTEMISAVRSTMREQPMNLADYTIMQWLLQKHTSELTDPEKIISVQNLMQMIITPQQTVITSQC